MTNNTNAAAASTTNNTHTLTDVALWATDKVAAVSVDTVAAASAVSTAWGPMRSFHQKRAEAEVAASLARYLNR